MNPPPLQKWAAAYISLCGETPAPQGAVEHEVLRAETKAALGVQRTHDLKKVLGVSYLDMGVALQRAGADKAVMRRFEADFIAPRSAGEEASLQGLESLAGRARTIDAAFLKEWIALHGRLHEGQPAIPAEMRRRESLFARKTADILGPLGWTNTRFEGELRRAGMPARDRLHYSLALEGVTLLHSEESQAQRESRHFRSREETWGAILREASSGQAQPPRLFEGIAFRRAAAESAPGENAGLIQDR
ncbi:MAG: hypothetical protein PW734_08955 [Verrucomicrobium sp.]|nr:hypothetical protein [Verrucomicrobium sp.]